MVVVTELLVGGSLRKYLVSLRPRNLELRVAVGFALDISRAMECLHAHGIIHRDLKPGKMFYFATWLPHSICFIICILGEISAMGITAFLLSVYTLSWDRYRVLCVCVTVCVCTHVQVWSSGSFLLFPCELQSEYMQCTTCIALMFIILHIKPHIM